MNKILMTDLGNTFCGEGEEVSKNNLLAIKKLKKNGYSVMFISGRSVQRTLKLIEINGLTHDIDYVFGIRGIEEYDKKSNKTKNGKLISKEMVKEVFKAFEDFNFNYMIFKDGTLYVTKYNQDALDRKNKEGAEKIIVSDSFEEVPSEFPRILIYIGNTPTEKIYSVMGSKPRPFNYACAKERLFEILPLGVTKGKTVEVFCKKKNIKPAEVVAFGDNENDIEMLQFAGYSVAMKNALPEVKSVADKVSPYNWSEDAFAKEVDLLLKKR